MNIPVGIELYDKNGILVDLNNKDMEIFGVVRKEDALGLQIFENPNIPSQVANMLRLRQQTDFRIEYSFDRAGKYYNPSRKGTLDLLCKATILYDSKGDLVNYVLINIDNTETTNANNRIRDFESMFNVIADFAKVGFLLWNPLTKEGFAIEQWFKNYGSESRVIEDVVGEYTTVHPEDRKLQMQSYQEMLEGKRESYSREIRVINPDGSIKWIRSTVLVKQFRPEISLVELIGVNFDITELKITEKKLREAKEKAEESDRLKSAFLANMSHEIRTPLNAIVGFSNLLMDATDEEEKRQYISIVEENNELLLKLISDILDLAKIEAGTFDMVDGEVDAGQLCSDIVKAVRLKAPQGVEIILEIPAEECRLLSDKNRIHQVIANFANNALKFTSQGSITIGYEVKGDKIEFYVRDTGIGIPEELQNQIFDRFVKLNSFVHGTGLGLSISQSIVRQLGGEIGVESEKDRGARFWFTLPLPYMPQAETQAQQLPQEGPEVNREKSANPEKQVILVAEDTESNYLLVSTVLKKEYTVYRASDGEEAVRLHRELNPDLILMDIRMPKKDGLEATREIREMDQKVPVIALTAFAYDQDRKKAIEAGCNDFLTKPITVASLKETIEKWIGAVRP